MGQHPEVSLEERQRAYDAAELRAVSAAERYVEARASGRMPRAVNDEMDAAESELRRAKRRLEETQRRLAGKRQGSALTPIGERA